MCKMSSPTSLINSNFSLSPYQEQQFAALDAVYREWNARCNVISRRDIDNLYEHHILHSLAIAKVIRFKPQSHLLDVGTGGGFPGIPLAILFPDCQFTLIDGIGKKIHVTQEIAKTIGLNNVTAIQRRAEEEHDQFDFIVSRAVMPLPDLARLVRKNIAKLQRNALPNGLIVLKGGDLGEEIKPFRHKVEVTPVSQYFTQPWFEQKYVIYLPL